MEDELKEALEAAIAAHDPEVYNRVFRKFWNLVLEREIEVAVEPEPTAVLH